MDALKINELEIENGRQRQDLKRLRDCIANNNNTTDQVKEMFDQFETLQEELDRRREECVQLRTVLANVSLSDHEHDHFSSFSKTGMLYVLKLLYTYGSLPKYVTPILTRIWQGKKLQAISA